MLTPPSLHHENLGWVAKNMFSSFIENSGVFVVASSSAILMHYPHLGNEDVAYCYV